MWFNGNKKIKMSENIENMMNKFKETYSQFKWRHGNNESKSGEGSSIEFTTNYRKELPELIEKYKIKKILDCSCGDWNWMKTISNSFVDYTGIDIVPELIDVNNKTYGTDNIRFVCGDMLNIINSTEEKYDLIICRHTFEHLPTSYVLETIKSFKNKTKYCLLSGENNITHNSDINFDGCTSRLINLGLEPYKELLGEPIYTFYDTPLKPNGQEVYTHLLGNFFELKLRKNNKKKI